MKKTLILFLVVLFSATLPSINKVKAGDIQYPFDHTFEINNVQDYPDYIFIAGNNFLGQDSWADAIKIIPGELNYYGGNYYIYSIKKDVYDNLPLGKSYTETDKPKMSLINFPDKFIKSDFRINLQSSGSPFGDHGTELKFKKMQSIFHITSNQNGKITLELAKVIYTSNDNSQEIVTGNGLPSEYFYFPLYPLKYDIEYWLTEPKFVLFLSGIICFIVLVIVLIASLVLKKRITRSKYK